MRDGQSFRPIFLNFQNIGFFSGGTSPFLRHLWVLLLVGYCNGSCFHLSSHSFLCHSMYHHLSILFLTIWQHSFSTLCNLLLSTPSTFPRPHIHLHSYPDNLSHLSIHTSIFQNTRTPPPTYQLRLSYGGSFDTAAEVVQHSFVHTLPSR